MEDISLLSIYFKRFFFGNFGSLAFWWIFICTYPHALHSGHGTEWSQSSQCAHSFEGLNTTCATKWSHKVDKRHLKLEFTEQNLLVIFHHTTPFGCCFSLKFGFVYLINIKYPSPFFHILKFERLCRVLT